MIRKTPEKWLETEEFKGTLLIDPDGWDRADFENDWNRELSRKEMHSKLSNSTTIVVGPV